LQVESYHCFYATEALYVALKVKTKSRPCIFIPVVISYHDLRQNKAFYSAQATLAGIEVAHMIRKKQLSQNGTPAYQQFMALAG
jgi:hypothetical protein